MRRRGFEEAVVWGCLRLSREAEGRGSLENRGIPLGLEPIV